MTAKADLLRALQDKRRSEDVVRAECLGIARKRKMSTEAIVRVGSELGIALRASSPGKPTTVEQAVTSLVRFQFGGLPRGLTLAEDHEEKLEDSAAANDQQKENTVSAVQGTVDLHTDTNLQNSEEISNKELHSIIRQLKSALEEERAEARDREARLIKKINELDSEVRSLSEKVHQLGAAEEDRAEKLTRRVNDVKACVKSTYQNTYTHTRIDSHSGSTDRASMSASSGSTTPSYSASVQAQAPEMDRPAPSSRDRNLGQETTPTPTTPTSVQHQLGQARPNGERRRQQEPQWDAPDDDEGLWTLVSEKKPAEKKAVLYLGKLKPGVKESEIIDYVNRRSEKLGALPPTIHNCKIFEKEVEEGEIIEFCGARLTIDKRSTKLLCHRKFWLGHSYARPWNFPDPSEAAISKPQT